MRKLNKEMLWRCFSLATILAILGGGVGANGGLGEKPEPWDLTAQFPHPRIELWAVECEVVAVGIRPAGSGQSCHRSQRGELCSGTIRPRVVSGGYIGRQGGTHLHDPCRQEALLSCSEQCLVYRRS